MITYEQQMYLSLTSMAKVSDNVFCRQQVIDKVKESW